MNARDPSGSLLFAMIYEWLFICYSVGADGQ